MEAECSSRLSVDSGLQLGNWSSVAVERYSQYSLKSSPTKPRTRDL